MTVLLSAAIFVYGCLSYVASMSTTSIGFSKNFLTPTLYLNILNPLDTNALVSISAPAIRTFPSRWVMVQPKNATIIELNYEEFEVTDTDTSGKGILISYNASQIIVTGLSIAENSGAMFLARNASQIGKEYIVMTHCEADDTCQFLVIATADDTFIDIILSEYFIGSVLFDETIYGPGDVINITLRESQTFQIQSLSDLTGTTILSDNRFSVLTGSSFTGVQTGTTREHLAEMLPPVGAWGNEYILIRRTLSQYLQDEVRLVATTSGANISISGCGSVHNQRLRGFQKFFYMMECETIHIRSDEPVLVAHFPIGTYNSDPAMFFATPIAHFFIEYVVYIPPGFWQCAISLLTETVSTGSFDFTGFTDSFTGWMEVEHTVYSAAWLNNMAPGVVKLTHTSPFGGHLLCEREYAVIALTLGLRNVTVCDSQLYTTPYTTTAGTDASTTQSVSETSTLTDVPTSAYATTYVTENSTNQAATQTSLKCSCYRNTIVSQELMLKIKEELKRTLSVPRKSTNNYRRSLISVWDKRESSAGIGALGSTVLCTVAGCIVAIDLATLMQKRK